MTNPARSQRAGFTLIEVLVALLVLTIVILTSLAVFADRSRRMTEAGEMALAWQVLANEAEAQRRQPFGALAPAEGVPFLTDPTGGGALGDAQGEITVTEEGPYLRALALRVAWSGGKRSAETIVYRASTGGGTLW
ncbi:MAG TPA: prepilin-type N-terminal cleavage/methylation domain-containing protein [Thermoanaerobaculia bacterium]|nr:prepilin-type N-terminal cleavage/methylation domain-containing protein [Thermoanaerobaculia bacterium]